MAALTISCTSSTRHRSFHHPNASRVRLTSSLDLIIAFFTSSVPVSLPETSSQMPRTSGCRRTLVVSVSPKSSLMPRARSSTSRVLSSREPRAMFSDRWSKATAVKAWGGVSFPRVALASVKFSRMALPKSDIREASFPCWYSPIACGEVGFFLRVCRDSNACDGLT